MKRKGLFFLPLLLFIFLVFSGSIQAEPWVGKLAFGISTKEGLMIAANSEALFKSRGYNDLVGFNFFRKKGEGYRLLNAKPLRLAEDTAEAKARLGKDVDSLKELGLDVEKINEFSRNKKIISSVISRVYNKPALARLFGLAYLDVNVVLGETYEYKVEAVFKNEKQELGIVSIAHEEKAIPNLLVKDIKVEAMPETQKSIKIFWPALLGEEVVIGYNLYRKKNEEPVEKLNRVPLVYNRGANVEYFETLPDTKNKYSYAVEAITGHQLKGKLSEWITTSADIIDGKFLEFRVAAEKLDGYNHKALIHVSWKTEGGFDSIKLLRKADSDFVTAFESNKTDLVRIKDNFSFYLRNKKEEAAKIENENFYLFEDTVEMPGYYVYKMQLIKKGAIINETIEKQAIVADKRIPYSPEKILAQNTDKGIQLSWELKSSEINYKLILFRKDLIEGEDPANIKKFVIDNIPTKQKEYLDTRVQPGVTYEYSMVHTNKEGEYGIESDPVRIKAEFIPRVLAIKRFNLVAENDEVCVSWDFQRERYATLVKVFKNDRSIGEVDYKLGKFCDKKLKRGEIAVYALQALNKISESQMSDKIKYTPEFAQPPEIKKITIQISSSKVVLKWDYDYDDLEGFEVFRKEKKGADYEKVTPTLIKKESFTEEVPLKNKTYYYTVVAIGKGSKRSVPSIPLEAKIK